MTRSFINFCLLGMNNTWRTLIANCFHNVDVCSHDVNLTGSIDYPEGDI